MAAVAKSGTPEPVTQVPSPEHRLSGKLCGEAIAAGDACYVGPDNKIYRSLGDIAGNDHAQVHGWAPDDCPAGESLTLYWGVNFVYGSALTPGKRLYVSATVPGGLSDTATTGGVGPVAWVYDPTRIHVDMSHY